MRKVVLLVAVIAALSSLPMTLRADSSRPATLSALSDGSPLVTSHPRLRSSLERIATRSRLWRADVAALHGSGRRVLVLTPEQVVVADSLDGEGAATFDAGVVAAAAPVPDRGSRVREVLVVVNLPLIDQAHSRKRSLPGEVELDVDLILAHEVYGHALPYLLAGDLSGRCADPVPGQRPIEACAIRRENAIRQEFGLAIRTGAGLESLLLARTPRF
jgi:hypothetical protein